MDIGSIRTTPLLLELLTGSIFERVQICGEKMTSTGGPANTTRHRSGDVHESSTWSQLEVKGKNGYIRGIHPYFEYSLQVDKSHTEPAPEIFTPVDR